MIIDCHTHLPPTPDAYAQLEQSMTEAGIERSLIIAETLDDNTSNIENILNNLPASSKFKIIANCVFVHIQDATYIENLKATLKQPNIVGLKFYLGYESYSPVDPLLFPLYDFCQAENIPVVFHTGVLEAGSSGLLKYSHPMLVDEVAAAFPQLTIVMAHMGNPWLIDCAAVLAKNPNVYADMSAFFEENAPITSKDIEVFKQRMEQVQVFLGSYKKFLFGSDWPLYSQKEYVAAVEALNIPKDEHALVMYENANRLFHLL